MGVKKKVQSATAKVTSRLKQLGFARKLSNPSSSGSLATRGIEWIYLIALFLLMAGIINAIGNAGTAGIGLQQIVPNVSIQNMTETFIILFGYIVGALGAYALYLSGRQTIRARSAEMFFVGAISLIALAMTLGYYIIHAKGG